MLQSSEIFIASLPLNAISVNKLFKKGKYYKVLQILKDSNKTLICCKKYIYETKELQYRQEI